MQLISVTCRNLNVDDSSADRDHGPIGVQTINFDVEVKRKGCESEVDVDFDSTSSLLQGCRRRHRAPLLQQQQRRRGERGRHSRADLWTMEV